MKKFSVALLCAMLISICSYSQQVLTIDNNVACDYEFQVYEIPRNQCNDIEIVNVTVPAYSSVVLTGYATGNQFNKAVFEFSSNSCVSLTISPQVRKCSFNCHPGGLSSFSYTSPCSNGCQGDLIHYQWTGNCNNSLISINY